jgi:hypothetical protein
MNYLHPHWHYAIYKGQITSKMTLERTYHSCTGIPNCLHVQQNLDLVRLGIGQVSNHLAVIIGIFNINGISLTELQISENFETTGKCDIRF